MGKMKVILNPVAGRGHGGRIESDLRQYLKSASVEFDLELTKGQGHAIELAQQASKDGFETVVAVGGDGTYNEVVNGLMTAAGDGYTCQMGVIPAGSGSDFSHAVGVSPDLETACNQLVNGQPRLVDIGKVTLPGLGPRYFDNTVGIGFDAIVTLEALKIKRLRGMALYLPLVLKAVFLYGNSPIVTIEYDNQQLVMPAMMVVVANGGREGGGFFIAPEARPDDGMFDLCMVREVGKLQTLGLIPHFMKGTHVDKEPVTMARARKVVLSSPGTMIAHADGEVLSTGTNRLEFEIIPQSLSVIS